MASPMPMAPTSGRGNPPTTGEADEYGIQTRAMGLKVHYTFDKEAKINCLARGVGTLLVQTVPIDETNMIGVVDLRACIHTITECSPELTSQECDYTIYAVDYSEPDTPLVGQGLLSWILESMRGDGANPQQPKMVTGRVAKNLLGVFGGGNREILEVRLKLSETTKIQRPTDQGAMDLQPSRSMETVMTPTGVSEWNSFIQSNPQIGQPAGHIHSQHSRVASPALSQGPAPTNRRDSFALSFNQNAPAQEVQKIAPTPVDPQSAPIAPTPSSRPSSRASNRPSRRKPPTGRPRGRPRKNPTEGNTSGYEDGTEGEEGPAKKRAKTTQVEKADVNAFGAEPESLRVVASNSSSLRNFRPIAINSDSVAGSHLQEVPRAPTPVPDGGLRGLLGRGPNPTKLRRESTLSQLPASNYTLSSFSEPRQLSPADSKSPESIAPTPNYSEDSPADIGSSPPIQRTTPYIRSSPPPSSPVLPPMPPLPPAQLPREISFTNNDVDQLFGEGPLQSVPQEGPPPPQPVRKAPKSTSGVPIQVFQIQGPTAQEFVHIRSYNTPHPSSSAPAPPEVSLLPVLKEEPVRPKPSGPAKRKRPRASSPPPLALTPPPTTDAVERAMSPAPTPTPASAPTSTPTPTPVTTSAPISAPISAPTPQPVAVSDDVINDPVVRLASTFSMREEPQPGRLSPELPNLHQPKPQPAKPKHQRQLSRSQSAGSLALPLVPASDPVVPSSLSQPVPSAPERPRSTAVPSALRRSASIGPLALPVPESISVEPAPADIAPTPINVMGPEEPCPPSDSVPPPSSPPFSRANKNIVKKHAIKQRLEEAINNGEMPPFCSNCGAIETPTWRKIWVQEREGIPENCEYSEKPGRVTAMEILKFDAENKPILYRIIKKSLATTDDRTAWQEMLLCNPCGIWFAKCKSHRPPDRWDKDLSRLGQERRRRGPGASRSKKNRTRDDGQIHPTSEAYLPTDSLEPVAPSSPKMADFQPPQVDLTVPETLDFDLLAAFKNVDADMRSYPGSTHSRGSGTAQSPIEVEFDEVVCSTKRLLFPSPKRDGTSNVLCDLDVNIVQTSECRQPKELSGEKENVAIVEQDELANTHDDLEALFRSPIKDRPSTPPPNTKSTQAELFKTPTRPTPNHRPITRSVSRSLRSVRSVASPSQQTLQRTPTKTPRTALRVPGSSTRRRSPRNHQVNVDGFDSPISRSIVQMLSEQNCFGIGDHDVDLNSLPMLNGQNGELIDFGNLLSTDGVMPSSPPKDTSIGFDYLGSANTWAGWQMDNSVDPEE